MSLIEKSFYSEDRDTTDAEQISGTGQEANADEYFYSGKDGVSGWNPDN